MFSRMHLEAWVRLGHRIPQAKDFISLSALSYSKKEMHLKKEMHINMRLG
jgi:hypothetical protein